MSDNYSFDYNFTNQELEMSVADMGLSTRATNALKGAGIETLADLLYALIDCDTKTLYIRNLGKTGWGEIHNKLAEMQTQKYRDLKSAEAAINNRKTEIKSKIEQYNKLIQELTAEQGFYDNQMDTLRQNYAKQKTLNTHRKNR